MRKLISLFTVLVAVVLSLNSNAETTTDTTGTSSTSLTGSSKTTVLGGKFCIRKEDKTYICGEHLIVADASGSIEQVDDVLASQIYPVSVITPSLEKLVMDWGYDYFSYFDNRGSLNISKPLLSSFKSGNFLAGQAVLKCSLEDNKFLFIPIGFSPSVAYISNDGSRFVIYDSSYNEVSSEPLYDEFPQLTWSVYVWQDPRGLTTPFFFVGPLELPYLAKAGEVDVRIDNETKKTTETKTCSIYVKKLSGFKKVSPSVYFINPLTGAITSCKKYNLVKNSFSLVETFPRSVIGDVRFGSIFPHTITLDKQIYDVSNGKKLHISINTQNSSLVLKNQRISFGFLSQSFFNPEGNPYSGYWIIKSFVVNSFCGQFTAGYMGTPSISKYYAHVNLVRSLPTFTEEVYPVLNFNTGIALRKALKVNGAEYATKDFSIGTFTASDVDELKKVFDAAKNLCPTCSKFYMIFANQDGKTTVAVFNQDKELVGTLKVDAGMYQRLNSLRDTLFSMIKPY